MGSCHSSCVSSFHKTTTTSSLPPPKLQMSPLNSIPSTPIKHKPPPTPPTKATTNTTRGSFDDPEILSVGLKSQVSPFNNSLSRPTSYGGSKDEAFFDTQGWLDSDCDDDFYSVNGDFTPSRGSTPSHNGVGSSRFNRTFSPQVNRALFDGRPPLRGASNLSRGSPSMHQRSSSATSPRVSVTLADVPGSSTQEAPSKPKKKNLLDLFRESIRDRTTEGLSFADYENIASSPDISALPPKPTNGNGTPYVSRSNSVSSTGKRTPATNNNNLISEKDMSLKASQCCFPRLVPSPSFRVHKKASSPPTKSLDDLKS